MCLLFVYILKTWLFFLKSLHEVYPSQLYSSRIWCIYQAQLSTFNAYLCAAHFYSIGFFRLWPTRSHGKATTNLFPAVNECSITLTLQQRKRPLTMLASTCSPVVLRRWVEWHLLCQTKPKRIQTDSANNEKQQLPQVAASWQLAQQEMQRDNEPNNSKTKAQTLLLLLPTIINC